MELTAYQAEARRFVVYPEESGLIYTTLGLASEAGEVAGKLKKAIRDVRVFSHPELRQAMAAELGDVLWYLAQTCTELGLSLDQVAQENLDKLQSRQDRGVIGGSGDNR